MNIPGLVRATCGSAGWDAVLPERVFLHPGETKLVGLALWQVGVRRRRWWWRFVLPYWEVHLRSSIRKQGVFADVGIIDADYRGEIRCLLHNANGHCVVFEEGDKVCQFIRKVTLFAGYNPHERESEAGFGSTGK